MAPSRSTDSHDLAAWEGQRIDAECSGAHSVYARELSDHYRGYFSAHPRLAGQHPLLAKDLEAALPTGWGRLSELIPRSELHRWYLSGKSSQVLGLGLVGAARDAQPDAGWLWQALRPALPGSEATAIKLEQPLPASVLNERPRQTAIDLLVETPGQVVCVEMKWSERGMGTCSCRPATRRRVADCAERVLERTRYWEAAEEALGLPRRTPGNPCPISWSYQAVRNVAAARALAGERLPVFALIYDVNNPYFGGHGNWPGWARVLDETINGADAGVRFASTSWQELAPVICGLGGLDAVSDWAREKHRLPV